MKKRVGIVGYGNLGKGVELAIEKTGDLELVAIFSRRDPETMVGQLPTSVFQHIDDLNNFQNDIDVLILCGGSRTDLPEQGPLFAKDFHTVDSFDTHAKIPEYFAAVDGVAKQSGHLSLISTGWDPGLFSIHRVLGEALLPDGMTHTFWGPGLSQGHSDAVRRIPGVAQGVQYTLPSESALMQVRSGENPELEAFEKHVRECYIVLEEGADADTVRNLIVTMPDYFADYRTEVHFITAGELERDHGKMPHGGIVIRNGSTGTEDQHIQQIEFQLKLESNAEFTASVLVAYARAVAVLAKQGQTGAVTVFDIPLRYLSPTPYSELLKHYL